MARGMQRVRICQLLPPYSYCSRRNGATVTAVYPWEVERDVSIIRDSWAEITASDEPGPAGADDDETFSQFFDQYHESVYTVAWRVLGDEALASDVTETAFCHAWRVSAHRGASSQEQKRWLLRLTHSIAISASRRGSAAKANPHAGGDFLHSRAPGENDTPDIPQPNAERIVELAFWGGLTCREIAESCRKATGDAMAQMRAGLHLLAGDAPPPDPCS